jgi:CheY-like chemotaxis protein
VVLRIMDSGPGIAPEIAGKLFDPFFTTKPPGEGTGLGLFLSYGIAESHGGTLTADSVPGEGATFQLSLPAATSAGLAAISNPTIAALPPRPEIARRVLVVDDDASVRRLVTVLFAHDGHTVDSAADGTQGLALAKDYEYDLVLMDRRAAAGAEPFAAALLRLHPDWRSRTLVAAAERPSGTLDDATASLRLLRKPFNLRDLRSAAGEVWENKTVDSR